MTGCTPEYEVEVQADPEDAGEIEGEGMYEEGEEVAVEVEPEEGYEFEKWEKDGAKISSQEKYEFEVTEDKLINGLFVEQTGEQDSDQDLPEELEQLLAEGEEDKIDGGILNLKEILEQEDDRRGPPLKAVTHLMVEDELSELEDMVTIQQLEEEAPEFVKQLDKTNIKWYYDDEMLLSIEELYRVLEKDWSRIICPSIIEYEYTEEYLSNPPEEPTPQYFDGIGAMLASPTGQKIAFDLDFMGACAFRIGAFGIIDLNDHKVNFTNIGWGDLAFEKKWSPDEEHIAYISRSDGPSGNWLHVDNINKNENMITFDVGNDVEKINSVLDKEGYNTLHTREPGMVYKDISWSDDGSTLKFITDFTNANWENSKESELEKIEWLFCVETEELKIKSAAQT